jgi:ParB family transcriptional regulator, chromosome partitioning protein
MANGRDNGATEAPAAVGVRTVPTAALKPNPHNPRYLFDREPLSTLKASIAKLGILVPLTVYEESSTGDYVILDGQRRWICAKELGLESVPVNLVEEPSLVQNIVTMFQIHKLREDWELMPTALKLQVLMERLRERNERQLAEITGLDAAVVSRCKKLLAYSPRYQEMMLVAEPSQRIKADFFIELYPVITDRVVTRMVWFKRDHFIKRMLSKYIHGKGLKAVTDFRRIKQCVTAAKRADLADALSAKMQEFVERDDLTIDHLEITKAQIHAQARTVLATLNRMYESLSEIDAREFYGEEELWRQLERLYKLIERKLRDADRRVV